MLIIGFVRKNISDFGFPYARDMKAQGFVRELFARMRGSEE